MTLQFYQWKSSCGNSRRRERVKCAWTERCPSCSSPAATWSCAETVLPRWGSVPSVEGPSGALCAHFSPERDWWSTAAPQPGGAEGQGCSQLHEELEARLDHTRHCQANKRKKWKTWEKRKNVSNLKNEWITSIIILIGFLKSAIYSQLRQLFSVNIFAYYLRLKLTCSYMQMLWARVLFSFLKSRARTPEILREDLQRWHLWFRNENLLELI